GVRAASPAPQRGHDQQRDRRAGQHVRHPVVVGGFDVRRGDLRQLVTFGSRVGGYLVGAVLDPVGELGHALRVVARALVEVLEPVGQVRGAGRGLGDAVGVVAHTAAVLVEPVAELSGAVGELGRTVGDLPDALGQGGHAVGELLVAIGD